MDKPRPQLRVTPPASLEERDALTAELEQYQSKLIEMTDVCIQMRAERNQIASERDAHRDHLQAIADMVGESDDPGAAWESVNAIREELERLKRHVLAGLQALGIGCNSIEQCVSFDREVAGTIAVLAERAREAEKREQALASHAEASWELEIPVCDTCKKEINYMPWHYSSETERHLHACNECWPVINLAIKSHQNQRGGL